MTIDIEKLIEEIDEDGSGEIEFDEFKALLLADSWKKTDLLFYHIINFKHFRKYLNIIKIYQKYNLIHFPG